MAGPLLGEILRDGRSAKCSWPACAQRNLCERTGCVCRARVRARVGSCSDSVPMGDFGLQFWLPIFRGSLADLVHLQILDLYLLLLVCFACTYS